MKLILKFNWNFSDELNVKTLIIHERIKFYIDHERN